jgi:hypothetical protein
MTRGGVASSTAAASACVPSARCTRHSCRRSRPATAASERRLDAGSDATRACTRVSVPPRIETNGAIGAVEHSRRTRLRPRMTLPSVRSRSRNRGNSARIDSRSASPPWMPASNGSPRRASASDPKRRVINDAIDSSPFDSAGGMKYSPAIRSFPATEKARDSANDFQLVGIPNTPASGNARNRP